jgi:hypothetical protein
MEDAALPITYELLNSYTYLKNILRESKWQRSIPNIDHAITDGTQRTA